jgi:transcriptional regulatory protein RtcR
MLLTGPTGAGKSQLATRIYQLKKRRSMLSGALVSVNCATLKGENAMAALFGHTKGAFTGAQKSRDGFLLTANNGVLFLDEIGELGLEEQAMLLHAIENKTFHPVGSDSPVHSDFQLIAGTNRDLKLEIEKGTFREDLLARINLWTYQLPALKDRKEDIPANVDYELDLYTQKSGQRVRFNKEAKNAFISFATSNGALWTGNFRDLSSAITRLCTLADSSRISVEDVKDEIKRLEHFWYPNQHSKLKNLEECLSSVQIEQLDQFDANQLNFVLSVCRRHSSMASAGRELFNVSRTLKAQANDSSRLQKYLAKFGLKWADI